MAMGAPAKSFPPVPTAANPPIIRFFASAAIHQPFFVTIATTKRRLTKLKLARRTARTTGLLRRVKRATLRH
jgi:hypothetical protein